MADEYKTPADTVVEPNEKHSHDHVDRKSSVVDGAVVLDDVDLLDDAYAGENREHEEGMWASVKSHPWACLWAFIMCFTIVSI